MRNTFLYAALVVAIVCAVSNVKAQNTSRTTGPQQEVEERSKAESAEIAEAIIVREEAASGRAFDKAFRAQVKANLASRSPEELAALEKRGFGLLPGLNGLRSTSAAPVTPTVLGLGSTSADLVFNPVVPCRILDTRVVGGPITGGSQRNFVAAATNYSGQGGFAGDCGIPFGPATAVAVNLTVANPAGPGDLRAFPFPAAAPLASVLNYANVPGLAFANGIVLTICDPAVSTCTFDFTIQADGNATDLVADVMGYFAAPVSTPLSIIEVQNSVSVAAGANVSLAASCAAGNTVTGGGCTFGSFTSPLVLVGTNPGGNGWICSVRNAGLSADTLTTSALCGATPGR